LASAPTGLLRRQIPHPALCAPYALSPLTRREGKTKALSFSLLPACGEKVPGGRMRGPPY
jgi:hypothetical protein